MPTLCRTCFSWDDDRSEEGSSRCPACRSGRRVSHAELGDLAIAHIDCDAFYASVEKRDDPALEGRAVIVGGGRRGVVSACCYIARINGVRSAMPMFKALKACPDAVVIRPDMAKYAAVGRQVKALMKETTPLVESLSIDEAFLDLSGTERVHKAPPAAVLARLVKQIEDEIGISASIGLAPNKFLAKMASDLDKPRGFSVIGAAEAEGFLAQKSVRMIWGVGASLAKRLESDGLHTIGQLREADEDTLMRRYGSIGRRLYRFAHGRDTRTVDPGGFAKSVSAETTLEEDETDADALSVLLWRLAEKVSRRLKRSGIAGTTVTLKLRTSNFKILTRSRSSARPTVLADDIYRTAEPLLRGETDGRAFRLIGVGVSNLTEGSEADAAGTDLTDLADPGRSRRQAVEAVMDKLRDQFGQDAITKGRGFHPKNKA